jgi:hypothetical protein
MNEGQMQAVLEELVATVAFLCEETASLIDDRAHRAELDAQTGIRGRAEEVRKNAHSLHVTLEALRRTNS